jgi:hypothetical protein
MAVFTTNSGDTNSGDTTNSGNSGDTIPNTAPSGVREQPR